MIRHPPSSTRTDTRLPYPTLFRSPLRHAIAIGGVADDGGPNEDHQVGLGARPRARLEQFADHGDVRQQRHALDRPEIGRAHVELQSLMRISYAVFCLNKNNLLVIYMNTY